MNVTVVIPFKSLDDGKSRLADVLGARARKHLCTSMLHRTLRLVADMRDVIVISDDERVEAIVAAAEGNASFLLAQHPRDLNIAVDEARMHVPSGSSMLVLPTDLVCLDSDTLHAFLSAPQHLGIAPDRAGMGTNLLYLPPVAVPAFHFAFGPGSLARHVVEAERIGFDPVIFRSSATAFDLDTPLDLDLARHGHCQHVPSTLPA